MESYCSYCNKLKSDDKYEINIKTKNKYKTCIECRIKIKNKPPKKDKKEQSLTCGQPCAMASSLGREEAHCIWVVGTMR